MKINRIVSALLIGTMVSAASTPATTAEAASAVLPQASHAGFTCPNAVEGTTQAQQSEIDTLLPSGDAMDDPGRLNASIDGLKRLGLSRTLIIDHLIGSYCPIIDRDSSLTNSEKAVRIRQFASRISPVVYSEENISDVLLTVFLKPSVVDEVNAKAQASGMSPESWLSKAIDAAVERP
jgi:hypothetical protein